MLVHYPPQNSQPEYLPQQYPQHPPQQPYPQYPMQQYPAYPPQYPPPQYPYPYGYAQQPRLPQHNGLSIAGFIVGLLATVGFITPSLGITMGIVGLVLAGVGRSKAIDHGDKTSLATWGAWLSALAILCWLLLIVARSA